MTLGVTTMAFSVYFSTSLKGGSMVQIFKGAGDKTPNYNPVVDTLTLKAGEKRKIGPGWGQGCC